MVVVNNILKGSRGDRGNRKMVLKNRGLIEFYNL